MAKNASKTVSVTFNGKEVSDLSELPPDVRALLADANDDGVPDIAEPPAVETAASPPVAKVVRHCISISRKLGDAAASTVKVDGTRVTGLEDVPEDMREQLRSALEQAGVQLPDVLRQASAALDPETPPARERSGPEGRTPSASIAPAEQRGSGTSWLLLLAAAVVGALVTWLLTHRS